MNAGAPLQTNFPMKPLRFLAPLRGEKVDAVPPNGEYLGLEQFESWSGHLSGIEGQAPPEGGANVFLPGDVLFGKLRPYLAKGWAADRDGFCTTEALVLAPKDADARFVRYCLLTHEVVSAVDSSTYGSRMPRADWGFIGALPFPSPARSLQERIANFLDERTVRIDALIAEKSELVAALTEYQYSYSSRLMTRGMDERVPCKTTSFPEIGEVPAHWVVKRLKFLGAVRSGVAKGKDLGDKETVTLPYLRVANVQNGHVDLTEVSEIEVSASEAKRYLLRRCDVLMNEGGDNDKLGRGAVWQAQIEPCIHQNHVFVVRLDDSALAEWVSRFTGTDAARAYFFLRSKQSTNLASINQSDVRELPVPLPPEAERLAVFAEIQRMTQTTTDLVTHALAHVDRLHEYRSSLISAAVTGQIDLKTSTAPGTQLERESESR